MGREERSAHFVIIVLRPLGRRPRVTEAGGEMELRSRWTEPGWCQEGHPDSGGKGRPPKLAKSGSTGGPGTDVDPLIQSDLLIEVVAENLRPYPE